MALVCLCVGAPAAGAGKPQVSIVEAIQEAIENNPGLLAERAGIPVAQTATITAGHSYTLTLTSRDDNFSGDPTATKYDDVATS